MRKTGAPTSALFSLKSKEFIRKEDIKLVNSLGWLKQVTKIKLNVQTGLKTMNIKVEGFFISPICHKTADETDDN